MAATETRTRKDGQPWAKPQKGKVDAQVIQVDEIPKFSRAGGSRTSEIDTTLAELAGSMAPGSTLCIRQYEKRESANGTLYNLRKRYNGTEKEPSDHKLKGVFEFNVGPLDQFGMTGMTGLFVTRTNGKVGK